MTKAEIVTEIAAKTGVEKQVVMQVVEGMMETIKAYHQASCRENSSQYIQEYDNDYSCTQYTGIQTCQKFCGKTQEVKFTNK